MNHMYTYIQPDSINQLSIWNHKLSGRLELTTKWSNQSKSFIISAEVAQNFAKQQNIPKQNGINRNC
jgi:hypothetical protein